MITMSKKLKELLYDMNINIDTSPPFVKISPIAYSSFLADYNVDRMVEIYIELKRIKDE